MEKLYNTVYFTINIVIFILIICQLFAKNKVNTFISSNLLLIACFIFIVFSKLLIINYNYDLSMDESYNFASYLAFQKTSDIYWRDIDCGTAGPLHILIPYLFVKIGLLPINWKAFHLFSTLIFSFTYLIFAKTILSVNISIENKYTIILIGLLPMCLSLSIAVPIFESELFPVFFFVLSIYFFSLKQSFAIGICMFFACISKLQIVPIIAALYLIFILFTTKKVATKISISGIITLVFFIVIVFIYGVWDEMIYYFMERNFNYPTSKYWFENILSF